MALTNRMIHFSQCVFVSQYGVHIVRSYNTAKHTTPHTFRTCSNCPNLPLPHRTHTQDIAWPAFLKPAQNISRFQAAGILSVHYALSHCVSSCHCHEKEVRLLSHCPKTVPELRLQTLFYWKYNSQGPA
jgi:hypothetical protein